MLTTVRLEKRATPFAHMPAEPHEMAGLFRSEALMMLTEPFTAAGQRGALKNTLSCVPAWNTLIVSQSTPGTKAPRTVALFHDARSLGVAP